MPTATTIAADPAWLPHAYDPRTNRVQFLHVDRAVIEGPVFLADHRPHAGSDQAWLSADEVAAMDTVTAPAHFIFHTAFCRSTLLVRALNIPGVAAGLSEPGILNSLALGGAAAVPLIDPCMSLLARPHGPGEAVVVKPSNVANGLIPRLMSSNVEARAVLMSNTLSAFCASVHRKGLMGRRWARRLHLHVQRYAPLGLGLDQDGLFELTDMQVAGLAWFLQQRWIASVAAGPAGERTRALDSDAFARRPADALAGVAAHFRLKLDRVSAAEVAAGPLFSSHAKLGGAYAPQVEREHEAARSPVVDEEIAMVAVWIKQIAEQDGSAGLVEQKLG